MWTYEDILPVHALLMVKNPTNNILLHVDTWRLRSSLSMISRSGAKK